MAAGRGQRMMPLTAVVPKAMAPYNGSTLIREVIREIKSHVELIHVTVGHKGAMLAEHLIESQVDSVINTTGHGNAWWIYNTLLARLDEPVLVTTCDNILELAYAELENEFEHNDEPACTIVPVKPIAGRDGDYLFHSGKAILDVARDRKSDLYCSGVQILNPVAVNRLTIEADDFGSVWHQLIPQNQLIMSWMKPRKWLAFDTTGHLVGREEKSVIVAQE